MQDKREKTLEERQRDKELADRLRLKTLEDIEVEDKKQVKHLNTVKKNYKTVVDQIDEKKGRNHGENETETKLNLRLVNELKQRNML